MTEAEWLACDDPRRMLPSLYARVRASASRQGPPPGLERFRLFACACCRRIWHLLRREDQEAVQLLEGYAQSLGPEELLGARKVHRPAGNQASNEMALVSRNHPASEPLLLTAWAKNLATSAVWEATAKKPTSSARAHLRAALAVGSLQRASALDEARSPPSLDRPAIDWQAVSEEELVVQATLLRGIFGNPFRPVRIDPAWLSWNGGTVPRLAQSIYDDRGFDRLAILADALEDAGCTDPEILGHCRGPGPHVRGCWVVDLVLGKE